MTVKAFAPDALGDVIKYSVFSGNKDGVFSLDSNSGNLYSSFTPASFRVTGSKYFSKIFRVEIVRGKSSIRKPEIFYG